MDEKKVDLLSLYPDELKQFFEDIDEPSYRAEQVFTQLHRGILPEEMTNLGRKTKEKIRESAVCFFPTVEKKLVSRIDGTIKYLFGLSDGNCVESVLMKYDRGTTICISSQVGCRMGCAFCASTIGGKIRDLAASELLGQVIAAQKDSGVPIAGIVMMGIGEPLDNYENVIRFLHLVGMPKGLNIGYRHISLSTCGVVPNIYRLAEEKLPITLSISLHAPDDETRNQIMPVNRRWGLDELLDACRHYFETTGRKISFEYTLIAGKNDTRDNALKLARLLNGKLRTRTSTMPIHVNLIPVNEVKERSFVRSSKESVAEFARTLGEKGIVATVRRKLGSDINASCGQLRRAEMEKQEAIPKRNEEES